MLQWKRVEQELASFILFGGIMSPELRKFVAELLFRHLYEGGDDLKEQLDQSPLARLYPRWHKLVLQLIEAPGLAALTRHNEDFAISVTRDCLEWCKRTYQEFEGKFERREDEKRLKDLQADHSQMTQAAWQDLLAYLQRLYPAHQGDWDFYAMSLKQGISSEEGDATAQRDMAVLKRKLLNEWSTFLAAEKEVAEQAYLSESFEVYLSDLSQKVSQLQELGSLVSPFYNFLGKAWNQALDQWKRINWDKLPQYAQTLSRDRNLRELAHLLGRWQADLRQRSVERAQKLVPRREWKPNPYGRSEIIGVHQSDHLNAMLPSEIALLSHPETEILLAKHYVEKKLLTFQYRSQDYDNQPKIEEDIIETDQQKPGPFVLVIDTSGSMFGDPERIAKALALAILNIALRQKRSAFLISFSNGIRTTQMTGLETNLEAMIDFLTMSFHGGTDILPALEATFEQLGKETYRKADVLIISDFIIPHLNRQLYDRVHELRSTYEHHFHSLYITRRAGDRANPLPIFDHHWVYDLDNPKLVRQAIEHFEVFEGEKQS